MNSKIQDETRRERGLRMLQEIDGHAGEQVLDSLSAISPDLARYILEYSFGDIYARTGLSLKAKEIAVVAALTALGNAAPQLRVHLHGALNVGCTVNDVKEVILQMSGYSGFPTALNAMNLLKEVLAERATLGMNDPEGMPPTLSEAPESARYAIGADMLSRFDAGQVERLEAAYGDFSPDLVRLVIHSYADVIARDNLSPYFRQIATIAALTALGNAAPQLRFHIGAGLNVGLTPDEIKEIFLLMTVYAGFPAALNAMSSLREVLAARAA